MSQVEEKGRQILKEEQQEASGIQHTNGEQSAQNEWNKRGIQQG